MKRFFITGGTGFLGSDLIKRIVSEKGNEVYALVRGGKKARTDKKDLLINTCFPEKTRKSAAKRIHFIKGDISLKNMGITGSELKCLRQKITHAYNSAGIVGFNENLFKIRKVNVEGTNNFCSVMRDWSEHGSLSSINHVSTAYVRGTFSGTFREDQIDVSQQFNNTYEKSKFEAEKVIEKYRENGMKINVFRPSLITRFFQEDLEKMDLGQKISKLLMAGFIKELPLSDRATVNMVPVELVSETIYALSLANDHVGCSTFHITNPRPLKFKTYITVISSILGFDMPKFVPANKFNMKGFSPIQKRLLGPFLPYMIQPNAFDMRNTSKAIKKNRVKGAYYLTKPTKGIDAS